MYLISDDIPDIYELSFMYYSITGTCIPIVVGLIVSALTRSKDMLPVEGRLLTPLIRNWYKSSNPDVVAINMKKVLIRDLISNYLLSAYMMLS